MLLKRRLQGRRLYYSITVLLDAKGEEGLYKGKRIAVVIPACNEEDFIREVVETVPSFVDRTYVTNDASTDKTSDILNKIIDERLVVTTHDRRAGVGGAIISGHKKALEDNIDVIAVMAGDGQMDPSILDRILDPVVEGRSDCAKGDRLSDHKYRKAMPAWRIFGNLILTYLTKIASGYWHVVDPQNGYTAISRKVLERIDLDNLNKGFAYENDLLVKLHVIGAKIVDIPHQARYRGERSKIKYPSFIVTTSWVLLKDFLWRLWKEYTERKVLSKTSCRGKDA